MRRVLHVAILLLLCHTLVAQPITIIPEPNSIVEGEGAFEFNNRLTLRSDKIFDGALGAIPELYDEEFDVEVESVKRGGDIDIRFDGALAEECYRLSVTPAGVTVEAGDGSGAFYALQTLRQLISRTASGEYQIPACQIEDSPKLSWRAYMLDEGRNFQGERVVKRVLDEMARMKMNIFHWHLTEDQGWRIEIEGYPLLTEVGAWRDSTVVRGEHEVDGVMRWSGDHHYSSEPAGGYYTQSKIREIVAYAAARHIDILPEIEMPGHASAAIAAYPWLLARDAEARSVPVNYGIKELAYNVADERVYTFLTDILTQVMGLFPFEVIHIGGDEVRHNSWEVNPDIEALMEREGLESYADVQIHFTNRISNFIESHGRRMMGWNEILGNVHVDKESREATSELAPSSVIHFWKGDAEKLLDAITRGYEVVNSWNLYTYLDYSALRTPIEKIYNFNPIPEGLTAEQAQLVRGVGYQMWGEVTVRPIDVYAFTFPRLAAAAEVAWSAEESKDLERFEGKLERMKLYWDRIGLYYREE